MQLPFSKNLANWVWSQATPLQWLVQSPRPSRKRGSQDAFISPRVTSMAVQGAHLHTHLGPQCQCLTSALPSACRTVGPSDPWHLQRCRRLWIPLWGSVFLSYGASLESLRGPPGSTLIPAWTSESCGLKIGPHPPPSSSLSHQWAP